MIYPSIQLHASDPAVSLTMPAPHSVQVPPSGPDAPALQMQSVEAELPAGASELVGQSEHESGPVVSLNFPAIHSVQVPPSGPEAPALQVQSLEPELPARACE